MTGAELHLNADLHKWGFWKGLCFFANGFQIYGRSITTDYVHSLVTVSNLEATPATKLYEFWFLQNLFHEHLSVRVAQLAADGDFLASVGGAYFLDGTWGWVAPCRRSPQRRARLSPGDSRRACSLKPQRKLWA